MILKILELDYVDLEGYEKPNFSVVKIKQEVGHVFSFYPLCLTSLSISTHFAFNCILSVQQFYLVELKLVVMSLYHSPSNDSNIFLD